MISPLLMVLALTTGDRPAGTASPLLPMGRLVHPPIREASGIVASRRHPGVFWVHNDSGNPPVLFAVRRDGTLMKEYAVKVPNLDWEDLASDDEGHLYIGEIGNNDKRLPLRAIYRLDEPDPSAPGGAGLAKEGLAVGRAWYYHFAPEEAFDAEGLFIDGRRGVLVAKTFDGREAELFAISLDTPAPLLRPATPERLGTLPGFVEAVTGASLAADGLRLAVCSYDVARVYGRDRRYTDLWTLLGTVRFKDQADGIEAITWDERGEDLILAGEGRGVYRITAATWQAGKSDRSGERTSSRSSLGPGS
jgi:hypothetical protein